MNAQPNYGQGEIFVMSLAFLIAAVVLSIIGNIAVLRYFVTRPLDVTFEE